MDCPIPAIQGYTTLVIPLSTDYFVVVVEIATLTPESVLQYIIELFLLAWLFVYHINVPTSQASTYCHPDSEPILSLLFPGISRI